MYVENAMDEASLVRFIQDNDFNINNLSNIKRFTLNAQAVNENQVIAKAYVDPFQEESERSRRDGGLLFYDEEVYLVKII